MSPPNNFLTDFSAYGYQIIQELGHNLMGGRVTYLVKEVATEQLGVRAYPTNIKKLARISINLNKTNRRENGRQRLRALSRTFEGLSDLE